MITKIVGNLTLTRKGTGNQQIIASRNLVNKVVSTVQKEGEGLIGASRKNLPNGIKSFLDSVQVIIKTKKIEHSEDGRSKKLFDKAGNVLQEIAHREDGTLLRKKIYGINPDVATRNIFYDSDGKTISSISSYHPKEQDRFVGWFGFNPDGTIKKVINADGTDGILRNFKASPKDVVAGYIKID